MTIIWLIVWIFHDCPTLYFWNSWAVSLAICLVIDTLCD